MIYIYKTDHRYAVVGFVLCRRRFNGRYQTDKPMQPIGRVLKILNAVYNGGFIFGRWCIFEVYDLHIAFNNIYFTYERHTPIGLISLGAFRRDPMTAFS